MRKSLEERRINREARKLKKPKANQKRPPSPSKCRDCGQETTIPRYEYTKASRPRCSACGGCLDYQGRWDGVKDRGRP